jgi:hypothetical protein
LARDLYRAKMHPRAIILGRHGEVTERLSNQALHEYVIAEVRVVSANSENENTHPLSSATKRYSSSSSLSTASGFPTAE